MITKSKVNGPSLGLDVSISEQPRGKINGC